METYLRIRILDHGFRDLLEAERLIDRMSEQLGHPDLEWSCEVGERFRPIRVPVPPGLSRRGPPGMAGIRVRRALMRLFGPLRSLSGSVCH